MSLATSLIEDYTQTRRHTFSNDMERLSSCPTIATHHFSFLDLPFELRRRVFASCLLEPVVAFWHHDHADTLGLYQNDERTDQEIVYRFAVRDDHVTGEYACQHTTGVGRCGSRSMGWLNDPVPLLETCRQINEEFSELLKSQVHLKSAQKALPWGPQTLSRGLLWEASRSNLHVRPSVR